MTGQSHTKRLSEVWHASNGGAMPTEAEPVAGGQGRTAEELRSCGNMLAFLIGLAGGIWIGGLIVAAIW